jgi:hypothetical protein
VILSSLIPNPILPAGSQRPSSANPTAIMLELEYVGYVQIGNLITWEFYHISNYDSIISAHRKFTEFFEQIVWSRDACADRLRAHAGMLASFLSELEICCIFYFTKYIA